MPRILMIATAVLAISAMGRVPVAAECIKLTTGDVLIGEIVEQDEDVLVLEHPVLGRVRLARTGIASITDAPPAETAVAQQPAAPAEAAPPETAPAPAAAPVAPPADAVAEIPEAKHWRTWLADWKMQLAAGFNFRETSSNRRTLDANVRFTGSYADEHERWKIDTAFYRSTVDGRESRNEFRAYVQKDWLVPESPWFYFVQAQYDRDDYKSWEHRLSAHGGIGYSLKPLLGIDANLRGGAGITREFGGVDPDTRAESLLGSEIAWQVTERHHVAATVQYFPQIDNPNEFRLITTADWTMKLTEELGLRLGVRDEYDSTEPPGFDPNDVKVFGSLVYSF